MKYTVLKQISCDKFMVNGHVREPINFHNGLNVVLGGKSGTNSIGKSTFLMILDFVFGGEDYIKEDKDVQKNVGQHTINFVFEFNEKYYYFSRSTKDFQTVNVCNENFEPLADGKMTLKEYQKFLAENYSLDLPGLTFRNAVSRFIRVYNRKTVNEKRPLQTFDQESGKQQVYGLLKLFDKYSPIKEREKAADKSEEAYTVFKNAGEYKYVPIVNTKKQYKENIKKIEDLKIQLADLESKNTEGTLNLDEMQAERLRNIRNSLSQLRDFKNIYTSRLNVVKANEQAGPNKFRSNYRELKQFFPEVNLEKIEEIDKFHHQVTKFLKEEFEKEKDTLENNISDVNRQINELVAEARKIKNQQAPNVQTAILNDYADKKATLKRLEDENKNYETKNELNKAKKDQKEALHATVNSQVAEVQHTLNEKMAELNEKICGTDAFQPPHIELKANNYSFETINDQGTGTSFKGLILFDQACLDLTRLPFFIHDSLMFSNIEVDRKNKIIEMYGKETKQVFISIDTIDLLSEVAKQVITDNIVLKLERGGKELFGRSWNEQQKSN